MKKNFSFSTAAKRALLLLVTGMLAVNLFGCSETPVLLDDSSAAPSDSAAAADSPAPTEEQAFQVGETVKLGDIVVSLVEVAESKGSKYNKPTDGNVYLLCEFEITNNSDAELSVSSMLSFDAYCDDYACSQSISALLEKGNKAQLDGTVAVGKKMKGVIGYEVAKDWKSLEVRYTPDILSSQEIVFVATND